MTKIRMLVGLAAISIMGVAHAAGMTAAGVAPNDHFNLSYDNNRCANLVDAEGGQITFGKLIKNGSLATNASGDCKRFRLPTGQSTILTNATYYYQGQCTFVHIWQSRPDSQIRDLLWKGVSSGDTGANGNADCGGTVSFGSGIVIKKAPGATITMSVGTGQAIYHATVQGYNVDN